MDIVNDDVGILVSLSSDPDAFEFVLDVISAQRVTLWGQRCGQQAYIFPLFKGRRGREPAARGQAVAIELGRYVLGEEDPAHPVVDIGKGVSHASEYDVDEERSLVLAATAESGPEIGQRQPDH